MLFDPMRRGVNRLLIVSLLLALGGPGVASLAEQVAPVHEEHGGVLAVEAEAFTQQTHDDIRAWHLTSATHTPGVEPDGDPNHAEGASGGAYLEILPDTRRTHGDKLTPGENFSNEPGKLALLHYRVKINTPGRYYVWARLYSTGSEDNGLHVGLNGDWPESGRRLQWCEGKNMWRWQSNQRVPHNHCGDPFLIYLDIDEPGEHTISFSMREDGTEFDKWLMVQEKYAALDGTDPEDGLPEPVADVDDQSRRDGPALHGDRADNGDGSVAVTGELRPWHKITLTLDGPFAHERDNAPNPFTDVDFSVTFEHESGTPRYRVPGYFAADGDAAETSAQGGTAWRAHLAPDKPGRWTYRVQMHTGEDAAIGGSTGQPVGPYDGVTGSFLVEPADADAPPAFRRGRLEYVGKHHLRFAGTGEYFLKVGADAPETFLAYRDFDGTVANKKGVPLKDWAPHARDWRTGDPTWQGGKGKGIVGAVNYLADAGANAVSFLTYNAGGDGDNVWPFVGRDDKFHYDCSKLDQWQIVLDHATALGLYLHFKLQETENDDQNVGAKGNATRAVPAALDGGDLGPERKLYLRQIVARFGHGLALNWNLGEENTQTPDQQRAMAEYLESIDPYQHHRVIHTYPNQQEKAYPPLLGDGSALTGASLQNDWSRTHERTIRWRKASAEAGKPWVVANDEQGNASTGAPPDLGYNGYNGKDTDGNTVHTADDIRAATLWGNLTAGGAGVEYYFGYKLPQNDLNAQDYRSRAKSWEYGRLALAFFHENDIPFWDMQNHDALVGNPEHHNERYCLAKPGEFYIVYLPRADSPTQLDLSSTDAEFDVRWYNPRTGGDLLAGSTPQTVGGGLAALGSPPADPQLDWVVLIRKSTN